MSEPAPEASRVDWTQLSAEGRETLREIAMRLWAEYTLDQIAVELGISRHQVGRRLDRLRAELREIADRA